jgi:hypothetical protein
MSNGGEVSVKFSSEGEQEVEGAVARVDASLKRFAAREIKLQTSDLDKLQAKLAKLDTALKAGLLTTEQHKFAVDTAEAEAAGKSLEVLNREIKTFADQQKRLDATPLDRLKQKQDLLTKAVEKGKLTQQEAGVAAKRHQDEYQRELDQTKNAQTQLTAGAVAGGVLIAEAWGKALGAVQRIASAMREENARALNVQQEVGRSLGSLAQLTSDPKELDRLSNMARDLTRTGAAPNIGAAVDTIFAASSAGALGDIENIRQLAEPGIVGNVPEFIRSAAALRAAMGEEQTGTTSDVIGKAFAAAAPTTTTAEQLIVGAARAGSSAKTQGIGVDELLAGTGILATARGSAEEGGTRMASLLRGMEDDKEIRGKSLAESIGIIQARNLPPEELTKQLTAEGADAFRILATNLDQLKKVTQETATQVTKVTIAERNRAAMEVPAIRADVIARQAKATADMQREAEGRVIALQEAGIEQGVTERRAVGSGGLVGKAVGLGGILPDRVSNELDAMAFGGFMRNIFATAPGNRLAESMAESERTDPRLREALTEAIAERDRERAEFASQMREASERFERASQNIERASQQRGQMPAVRPNWSTRAQQEAAVPTE